jgi:hypothetical protein
MIDPDLKTQLDQLNLSLVELKNKKSGGVWRSFFNGVFAALGYVVGLILVVIVLGFVLEKTGQLPAFEAQIKNFSNLLGAAERLIPDNQSPSSSSGSGNNQQSSGTPTIVTLPNGQQVKVNIQQ